MLDAAQPAFTPLSDLGEFALIDRWMLGFPPAQAPVIQSVGDDCAVVDASDHYRLYTTDILAEGVHFDRTYSPLKHLGYKAVQVNLSDVYAMNGEPVAILVSLAVSDRYSVEALDDLYAGIRFACQEAQVQLIGGDTTNSRGGLFLSITAIGRVQKDRIAYRRGAAAKELLVLSGDVGAAYAGLQVLEREKRVYQTNPGLQPALEGYDYVLERQLRPQARRSVWEVLRDADVVPTSMIDVSDGVASELHHLAKASGLGFQLYQDKLPIDPQTVLVAEEFNLPPTTCALYGGEDYELLFTIRQADYAKLKDLRGLTVIGHVTPAGSGVQMVLADGSVVQVPAQGFSHFAGTGE